MSEKSRELSPEEKLWAVKEYLSGKGSTYSIADKYGVTHTSIRRWVARYKIDGEQAFHKKSLASSLSQEEKLRAVHEYLQGVLSLQNIALKYGIGDCSVRISVLQDVFNYISRPTALYFWEYYPSREYLKGKSVKDLRKELVPVSHNKCSTKTCEKILDAVASDKVKNNAY